jgi:hypothetical protein
MRELIERFSYRYQLWREEQEGERWGPDPTRRNPLRYIAAVVMLGVILDIAQPFVFHRAPRVLELASIPVSVLFLILYFRYSKWAWYICVGWLMLGFLAYWFLYFAGYAPYQLRPRQPSVFVVLIPHIILTAALIGWFFWVRERYFRFIRDASSPET